MRADLGRWAGRGLVALGVGLLGLWAGWALDSRAFEAGLGRRLESIREAPPALAGLDPAGAARREALASGLVGRIEIPRLGISAMVAEGTDRGVLRRAVGHVEGTAFPGERGNVGIAGHRDTHFRNLKDVANGDRITLDTPGGTFDYQVDSILIVRPDRADLLANTDEARLTLVTCYPFYFVGPAPKRFVVRARPVGALARGG